MDKDCHCPLNSNLGYEGKVAMVSWVESAESYIFQTKEILMARHPTFVLRRFTCTKITICCQGHLSQERIVQISKRKLPLVWICRPFWCPGPRSQGCKSSSGQLQPYFPSCSQPGKSSIVFGRCCKLRWHFLEKDRNWNERAAARVTSHFGTVCIPIIPSSPNIVASLQEIQIFANKQIHIFWILPREHLLV